MEESDLQASDNNDITLLDLVAKIFRYRFLIIIITVLAMIGVVIFSIFTIILPPEKSPKPNVYTSTAHVLISESSSGSSMSSILNSSGLGALAGMVGVSVPTTTSNSELAKFLVHSNYILDKVINMFDLKNRYKIELFPITNTRIALKEKLTTNIGKESGVFSISFIDRDPVFAKDVVNYVVKLLDERFNELSIDTNKITKNNLTENINNSYNEMLNLQKKISDIENSVSNVYNPYSAPSIMKDASMLKLELEAQKEIYKQLKAQDELLKVELASEKPVFQVLQYGEVSDKKSGPSRSILCISVSLAAFIGSILLVFLIDGIKNIKRNLEIMKKLKEKK